MNNVRVYVGERRQHEYKYANYDRHANGGLCIERGEQEIAFFPAGAWAAVELFREDPCCEYCGVGHS